MKTIKIKTNEIKELSNVENIEFPKYTTQIMNLANQNAQGTVPRVVGQMSDLIQEFSGKTIGEWEVWYKNKHPEAIQVASDKVLDMVEKLKGAIQQIDKELIQKWVEDLVVIKTFIGLKFQSAILKKVADIKGCSFRLATPIEESKGIDGFVGDKPVSIKPITYKYQNALNEKIECDFIFYDKKKDGINIEFNF
ncbi:MAG: MjaI family restriction endonuclease [Patescibacteria group bacterium]|jgi:hypothetical protein